MQSTIAPGRACEHCHLEVQNCKGCGAEIVFGKTTMGKPWPLDAKVTSIAARIGNAGKATGFWNVVKGHVPHHITCPKREEFRS